MLNVLSLVAARLVAIFETEVKFLISLVTYKLKILFMISLLLKYEIYNQFLCGLQLRFYFSYLSTKGGKAAAIGLR